MYHWIHEFVMFFCEGKKQKTKESDVNSIDMGRTSHLQFVASKFGRLLVTYILIDTLWSNDEL